MASQLFKSGTSIGANTWEAQHAEREADIAHKFKIAAKETDETTYWIELCKGSKHYPDPRTSVFSDLKSIVRMLSKIISTTKRNKLSN